MPYQMPGIEDFILRYFQQLPFAAHRLRIALAYRSADYENYIIHFHTTHVFALEEPTIIEVQMFEAWHQTRREQVYFTLRPVIEMAEEAILCQIVGEVLL